MDTKLGHRAKDFEKRKAVTDESGKRHEKCQQPIQERNMTIMEKSWVMMVLQIDKKHEE